MPKKGPKNFRLIHDLRLINEKSITPSLVYEDIFTVTSLCEPNDYLTTIDIKDGYHHIGVHENFRTFLGFKFENTYYEFCVLPFVWLEPFMLCFYKDNQISFYSYKKINIKCASYVDDF